MHFSENPGNVRVELFSKRDDGSLGKWRYTIAVDMSPYYSTLLIHDALQNAIRDYFKSPIRSVTGFNGIAICFDPYYEHAHPIWVEVNY